MIPFLLLELGRLTAVCAWSFMSAGHGSRRGMLMGIRSEAFRGAGTGNRRYEWVDSRCGFEKMLRHVSFRDPVLGFCSIATWWQQRKVAIMPPNRQPVKEIWVEKIQGFPNGFS
jgi:hypothetical protein